MLSKHGRNPSRPLIKPGRAARRAFKRTLPTAMRIMLVTDAWDPQVNGVVRTMKRVISECEEMGHTWDIVSPNGFRTIPLPTYSEIRLAFGAKK